MSNRITHMGDSGGHGHDLHLTHFDDGTVVLHSFNPDTDEHQRIVLLEDQWRRTLGLLLEIYGKDKCCFFSPDGRCRAAEELANA
jgi:hypothetical protein